MMDPELQALIEKGIAAGYSDEDIKSLAEEHARRKTSQLTVMPNATTIQQDPSGRVMRAIDTALYEAKGVPGIVVGGVKNAVGGVNSVLDLVSGGRARIPINTEASNQDQRLGDVAATAAQLAPLSFGAVKGVEAAVPVAARMTRAAAPVVGGVAGAAEGYRRHGLMGAVEGGVIGAAGGGFLGGLARRGVRGAPGVVKAAEEALAIPDAVKQDAAAERAWLMRRSGESTPSPAGTVAEPGSMGGPLANAQPANPRPLAVHDSQAIKDMMRPEAQAFIESEFKANNPIFRQMQGEGQFGQRGVDEATQDLVNRLRARQSSTAAPEPMTAPSRNRGLTKDAAERAANQATPGWQEVPLPSSLEELMTQQATAEPSLLASHNTRTQAALNRARGVEPPPTLELSPEANAMRAAIGVEGPPSTVLSVRGGRAGVPPAQPTPPSMESMLMDRAALEHRAALEGRGQLPQQSVNEVGATQRSQTPPVSPSKVAPKVESKPSTPANKTNTSEPAKPTKPAIPESEDAIYYRLKVKPHLNAEEQAIFNKLEAKRRGTAYAAGRKP